MEYRPLSRVTRRATTPRVVWLGLLRYSRSLRPSGLTSLRSRPWKDNRTTRRRAQTSRPCESSQRKGASSTCTFFTSPWKPTPSNRALAFREKTLLTKTFRPRAQRAAKADCPLTACHHHLDLRSRKTQAGQGFDRLRADGTKRDPEARHRFHPGTLDRNRRRVGLAHGLEAGNGKPCGSIRSRLQVEPLGDELQNDVARTPLEHPKQTFFKFPLSDEIPN